MKNKYLVKHNFMYQGQFVEAGSYLEAEPIEVRYLVLGGQLEPATTEEKNNTERSGKKK